MFWGTKQPALSKIGVPKVRQWFWFMALWIFGFLSMAALSLIVKLIMKI